ncbi:DUF4954 family protein [candidate division KSB1 bacterium]|nr:DUF4954 family protein [candidate division KSB1 bacterium]
MLLRNLCSDEITQLENQGCWAEAWETVRVVDHFNPHRIQRVRFYGAVELGDFSADIEVEAGVRRACGIYDSTIQDCRIADNVRIADVGELVRYTIETGAVLQKVDSLIVVGDSTFGNGIEIDVLNEGGGRTMRIFDRLSAQLAYCLVHYRHDSEMVACIEAMITDYCLERQSSRGVIGSSARIERCGVLRNVRVGPFAEIRGAVELANGTLASVEADPVRIGSGVIARDFIVQSGSHISDGVMLTHTFVGQGVRLGKQFSAEHSAFFANCEGYHGEALSVLAGPYTVTHHKSTLLIAAQFSFFNAGSNSNQSNHMYKLGPLHQGILERGAKTGSGSYLLWPCRVGAFTAVIGKHAANFDASELPFSYIDVQDGKTFITPAMNLFTVGTKRDSSKWPQRDRRKDAEKHDRIHFDLFNPYIMGRVLRGIDLLDQLVQNTPREHEIVKVKGLHIKRLLLKTCRKYYEIAVQVAIGQALAVKLEAAPHDSWRAVRDELAIETGSNLEEWIDICGLLAPQSRMQELLVALRSGEITDLEKLDDRFADLYRAYDNSNWSWIVALIEKRLGISWNGMENEQVKQLIQQWRDQAIKLNKMILMDAEKEFDVNSRIGYGVDGNRETIDADFTAVRGTFAENSFVWQLKKENTEIAARADALLERLKNLSP